MEKSNSILFLVLKYPPNSIPKDLSGFKFGFGTTTLPGSESKTLARSSIFGDLKAVLILNFQLLYIFLTQLNPIPPTNAPFSSIVFSNGKS